MNAPKNEMGRAGNDLQRREMRTHVSAWEDIGANVGDNINMVIKVSGYSCANTVLYVHGHITENVAGAWQKFPNERSFKMKIYIKLFT